MTWRFRPADCRIEGQCRCGAWRLSGEFKDAKGNNSRLCQSCRDKRKAEQNRGDKRWKRVTA